MVKRRIPRKTKKWHRKNGWTTHFTRTGRAYFSRTIAAIDTNTGEIHFRIY